MNLKVIFSFAIIYIIWGSTFTAIKWGLDSFPPFMLAGLRFFLAGLVFIILAKGKIFQFTRKELFHDILIGVLLTFSNAGVCWAEEHLSSSVTALIVGALPMMFMLFNWISFEKQIPHISSILGMFVGFTGIALISFDNSSVTSWGVVLALIFANALWVIGSLIMRTTVSRHTYFPRASVQMIFGASFLFLMSSFLGERNVMWDNLAFSAVTSILYLSLAGTILAYTCYSYLLKNVSTELTSTYALVNPLVAIFLGVLWLNEPFSLKAAIATPLILLSVALVLYGKKFFGRKLQEPINL